MFLLILFYLIDLAVNFHLYGDVVNVEFWL